MERDSSARRGLVLVADNDLSFAQAFTQMLELRGLEVVVANSPEEVLKQIGRREFDLLTLDLDWDDDETNGINILGRVRTLDPLLPVIMVTEHASIATAVEATRLGAFNYIEKMTDREKTLLTIRNAIESGRLKRENGLYLREIRQRYNLIGTSPAMALVREQVQKAGPTDSVILVIGESGTGKELVAHQIHFVSQRLERRFVSVDAGTLADSLAESELFGHRKGAFTGAYQDRKGLIEEAEGGTLFLDEISNASSAVQARLLHLIQEREYRRVGDNEVRRCNIRIIAATNQNLQLLADNGRFRSDLYYRLKVIEITIPPLRIRKDDIPVLVRHFAAVKSRQSFGQERTLSPEAINLLFDYDWPGNVRELENAVERIVIFSHSDVVGADEVKEVLGSLWLEKEPGLRSLNEMTREFKRECVIKAINLAEGRIARAAEILQIDRTHLYKLMSDYRLKDLDK